MKFDDVPKERIFGAHASLPVAYLPSPQLTHGVVPSSLQGTHGVAPSSSQGTRRAVSFTVQVSHDASTLHGQTILL